MDKAAFLPPGSVRARAEDPRAYLTALRAQGKVVVDAGEKVVLDPAGVERVLTDFAHFSCNGSNFYGRSRAIIPQQTDPPLHTRYRRLLTPLMSVRRMAVLEPELVARTNACIDGFIGRGWCEARAELAVPVPGISLMNLLGLPVEDLPFFMDFKDAILRPRALSDDVDEQLRIQREFADASTRYFTEVIAKRRAAPGDDLISGMMAADVDGVKLTDDEILDVCFQLPMAGLDTVTATIALGLIFFAGRPDLQDVLASRPEMVESAVEELLRWETPNTALKRQVAQETEIEGCPFHPGERALASIGAANYDPSRFERPLEFDIARAPNRHMTFGTGQHTCLGNHLARPELRVVLREWHKRIPRYRVKAGAVIAYSDDNMTRTVAEAPLEWV